MAHTPTTPAVDERPKRLLERTPVDDAHKALLLRLVDVAQEAAAEDGEELQAEFGKEAVAMIRDCTQFVRLFRGGEEPGVVELLLPDVAKKELQEAGFGLREPEGAVFRLFGWVRLDPLQGSAAVLEAAVRAAYQKAV